MEQHPIPRQITTFEFKLIGFMTLKQFLYLLVATPTAFIVFKLFPIPIINFFLGLCVIGLGVALAFLPVNERPLDVWLRNLIKRLNSPTQYVYHKHNSPLYFLEDLYFVSDPHKVLSHIESREKLAAYLEKTQPKQAPHPKKSQINALLKAPTSQVRPQPTLQTQPVSQSTQHLVTVSSSGEVTSAPIPQQNQSTQTAAAAVPPPNVPHHAFFTGVVKNNKKIPLPGILVYVKDTTDKPIRLLKTNPHGIFATYNALPDGEYKFEIKDPNGGYNFDTMNMHVPNPENRPYEFYSKELM
ncbi:MAG: PrgI family protein [Patescibacteria group bacterium]